MNFEESRLRSFKNWPSTAGVDPRKIAKAGFYYMGQGLKVQCFSCGSIISDWNLGDRVVAVITRHKALDPGCPFIRDPQAAGNVPIGSRRNNSQSSGSESHSRSSSYGSSSLRQESFASVEARLETFSKWPVSYISAESLAKSGFLYTGIVDRVQCAFCGGLVESWEQGDSPNGEHKRHFPKCPFINKVLNEKSALPSGICFRNSDQPLENGDYTDLKWLGVSSHRVARSPKYSTFESRVSTFKHWPPSIHQTPEQLADAGFYFTGHGDQVRCFHCDGGLRLWEKDDVPWEEHARWFSDCSYLFLVKGQRYIDDVLDAASTSSIASAASSLARSEQRCQNSTHEKKSEVGKLNGMVDPSCRQRNLSEEELQALMCSPVALTALEVGLEPYRVKMALKLKVETTGTPYHTPEALIGAAITYQNHVEPENTSNDEQDDAWMTPPNSPVPNRRLPRRPHNTGAIASGSGSSGSSGSWNDTSSRRASPARSVSPRKEKSPSIVGNAASEETPSLPVVGEMECRPCSPSTSTAMSSVRDKSIASLEEEVRRLREWRQCKVCMDREVCVVLLPCGHLVTCAQCAYSLADCPLCRSSIMATVRTFLS